MSNCHRCRCHHAQPHIDLFRILSHCCPHAHVMFIVFTCLPSAMPYLYHTHICVLWLTTPIYKFRFLSLYCNVIPTLLPLKYVLAPCICTAFDLPCARSFPNLFLCPSTSSSWFHTLIARNSPSLSRPPLSDPALSREFMKKFRRAATST
jgi:hypothetical protein